MLALDLACVRGEEEFIKLITLVRCTETSGLFVEDLL
jgi:hypothetical protein